MFAWLVHIEKQWRRLAAQWLSIQAGKVIPAEVESDPVRPRKKQTPPPTPDELTIKSEPWELPSIPEQFQ